MNATEIIEDADGLAMTCEIDVQPVFSHGFADAVDYVDEESYQAEDQVEDDTQVIEEAESFPDSPDADQGDSMDARLVHPQGGANSHSLSSPNTGDALQDTDRIEPSDPEITDKTDRSDARNAGLREVVDSMQENHSADRHDEDDQDDEENHDADDETSLVLDGRPIIRVSGGDLPQILARAEDLLAATGRFFCSGKQIVSVQKDRVSGDAAVVPATQARLSVVLSDAAAWLMKSGRNGELRRVDAPDGYCAKLLKQEQFEVLHPLTGLARQPFLRQDGSLCSVAGYDPATGLYGVFTEGSFDIPDRPSRSDAEAALERLEALLAEFPFVSEHDRSAALAAMLTAAVRPSLALAPMFLVTAPEAGTGKTLLCHVIAALVSARMAAPQTFPRSEEEVDRVLVAELRNSPPVVFFDNLTQDIPAFQKLCVILTSESVSGRILRTSNIATVSTRTLLLASGNHVKPSRDMQRRCITITLDPKHEMPASRVFGEPDLLGRVRRHRGELVADALTVVRAWLAAGSPVTACPPLVSYEDWASWCRQPLLWLGRSDPAQSAFEAMHEDPDRQLLRSLLGEWNTAFGSTTVMVRDLVEHAISSDSAEELKNVLIDISDQGESINRKRIGRWIARHAGRIVGGFRIERMRRTRNADAWRVVSV